MRRNHKCFLCDAMIRRSEFLCGPCSDEIDDDVTQAEMDDVPVHGWAECGWKDATRIYEETAKWHASRNRNEENVYEAPF